MKYYLHDTSAFQDEKICQLFMEFGYEGLGLFYTLLEKLAMQEKPVNTLVLKKQLFIGKKLEKCWKFMEEISIISSNNGETFNENLLNFSEKYQIKKEKNRKKISDWREKQAIKKNVTSYEPICNTPKVKESKVKESKVNNIEFNFGNLKKELWEKWIQYKKDQFKFKYKSESSEQIGINNLIKLSGNDNKIAEEIINQTIANGWEGLFPLRNNGNALQLSTEITKESKEERVKRTMEIYEKIIEKENGNKVY